MSEGMLVVESDGTILWANPAITALLGHHPAELVGRTTFDLQHPDDAALSRARRDDPERDEARPWHGIRRVRHVDGTYRLLDCTAVNLYGDPRIGATLVTLRESSQRHQAWETERRLRAIVEHTQDIVTVYGPDLQLTYATPSAIATFPDVRGTLLDHVATYVHPDHQEEVLAICSRLLATPGATVEAEIRIVPQPGNPRWFQFQATNLLDDPAVSGVVLTGRDVTAQVELQSTLQRAATHDALTGLPNRSEMMDLLATALEAADDPGTVAVLFLDLDRFKFVNDSFGHATGDRVLIELGWRLREIVGDRGTVGRFGGDEYVVIAVLDAPDAVAELAELLNHTAAAPFTVVAPDREHSEVFLSGSVGVALGWAGTTPAAMLHHADAAMYRAKEKGRGAWAVYDEGMRRAAHARLTTEAELARALQERGFELHYQPIVEVTSGAVQGFEALARWRHHERGIVAPDEFIHIAEETGGIHRLGEWALATACLDLRAWQSLYSDDLTISVNLSPRQLSRDQLAVDVADLLEGCGVEPSTVTLEITETLVLDDLDLAIKALSKLQGVGVQLALDDFGTGWSSLTYLRSVPVDIVKIDRSFIQDVAASDDDRTIVGAVVAMCRALGKRVVAEGVETESQLVALRQLGATLAQGFLFARPMPAREIPAWLDAFGRAGHRAP